MKFAAWRKVLSIFLLAVFLCAVPSLLTACSRSPASGSTELLDSTQLYFIELGRLVPGFEQPMLDSFREAAEKLDACVKAHDAYFAECIRMQRRHSRSWCSSRMFWSRIWELPGKTATICVSFRRIGIPA